MGEGIRFAWQMGNCDAVLEGDSQKVVVHSLLGSSISSLSISNNISGALPQLQLYQSVQISHVTREGNKAAHVLAQYVEGISYFVTWIGESLASLSIFLLKMYCFYSRLNEISIFSLKINKLKN
ncbi:hypothetical protein SO802_019549 [Lithocarpus litseifolius]|uniref:RNase H type-1 domain-containing protein n=1 Tax=Lithocarpus litseifolius TaxID=425828 RepID=A0AAW2CNZ6_9ROSI